MSDTENFQKEKYLPRIKNLLQNFKEKLNILPLKETAKDQTESEIKDKSENFLKEYNTKIFDQYRDLYYLRLEDFKKNLLFLARKKWKNIEICSNVVKLQEGVNEK